MSQPGCLNEALVQEMKIPIRDALVFFQTADDNTDGLFTAENGARYGRDK